MTRFLRTFFKIFLILLALLLLAGLLFLKLSPEFGGKATSEQIAQYEQTGHFSDGKFHNSQKIVMSFDRDKIKGLFHAIMSRPSDIKPQHPIAPIRLQATQLFAQSHNAKITWLSHSAFVIQIDHTRLLLDPMLGDAAAPLPWFVRRFNTLPITTEELPHVDAVLISHDHYDHLDYTSIAALADKVTHFYVPLGVGNHLRRWGIPDTRITELDWWQEATLADSSVTVALTPSRHMSGRGITDHKTTLWGSWAILGSREKVYFSGDGGYGNHFKAIGKKYGGFDIALMECGQYSPNWKDVHMTPEESIQAAKDVNASLTMPIHWGAFVLSTHSWTEPAERCTAAAHAENINITTPQAGETIELGQPTYPTTRWWQTTENTHQH